MRLRLWLKLALKRFVLLVEFCKDCGVQQPIIWRAGDVLWERFRGGKNVLCPQCFSKRAERQGVLLYWKPTT